MGRIELILKVDAEVLEKARSAGIDLNLAFEAGLRLALETLRSPGVSEEGAPLIAHADEAAAEARAEAWARENAEAVAAYNERIRRRGVFGEDLRRW